MCIMYSINQPKDIIMKEFVAVFTVLTTLAITSGVLPSIASL